MEINYECTEVEISAEDLEMYASYDEYWRYE
jgi:hypothetical protein